MVFLSFLKNDLQGVVKTVGDSWEGGQLDFPDKLPYEYGNEFKQNIWVINDKYFKKVG